MANNILGCGLALLVDNTEKYKELAAAGDDDFVGLVKEIKTRPEFKCYLMLS